MGSAISTATAEPIVTEQLRQAQQNRGKSAGAMRSKLVAEIKLPKPIIRPFRSGRTSCGQPSQSGRETSKLIRIEEARDERTRITWDRCLVHRGVADENLEDETTMATTDTSGGLSKEEREAVKQRAMEVREQKKAGKSRQAGEQAVLGAIAELEPEDRVLAEGLHKVVVEVAPDVVP
jgi:hypothetical protein